MTIKIIGYSSDDLEIVNIPKKRTTDSSKDLTGKLNCCYCECKLIKGKNYTKEHIIPRSWGGKGSKVIRPCCKRCNTERGNLALEAFVDILSIKGRSGTLTSKRLAINNTKIKNIINLIEEFKDFVI